MPCLILYNSTACEEDLLARMHTEAAAKTNVQLVDIQTLATFLQPGGLRITSSAQLLPPPATVLGCFSGKDTYGWQLLNLFPHLGYRLGQPNTVHYSKLEQLVLLQKAGLKVPTTTFVPPRSPCPQPTTFPLVAKPIYGGKGHGVALITCLAELETYHDAAATHFPQGYLLQTCLKPLGEDIRAVVIEGKVVAAMRRVAPEGDFRANISIGGRGYATHLSPEEEKAVLCAVSTYGVNIAGVDFIRTETGPVFLEVNKSPGISGIEAATGVNVMAAMLAAWLKGD